MVKFIKHLIIKLFQYFDIQLVKSQYFSKTKYKYLSFNNDLDNKVSLELVETIMNFYKDVPPFYYDDIRDELKIGGAWKNNLIVNRQKQLEAIENNDVTAYSGLLNNMFRNEMVYAMWQVQYFDNKLFGNKVPSDFNIWIDAYKYLTGRSEEDLVVSSIGNPWGCEINKGIIKVIDPAQGIKAQSIINLLYANYLEDNHKLTLFDLGSGFGGDVEKVARWYKEPLRIILMDIPMNLTTAYAYISSCFKKEKKVLVKSLGQLESTLEENKEHLEFIFLPTCFIENLNKLDIDILHNHGSFSEMDYKTIKFYLESLLPKTKYMHEINSSMPATLSNNSHVEVSSKEFPIPDTHCIISRTPTWTTPRGHRYLTSIYKRVDHKS
jgi:hypothetical protein